MPIIPEVQNRLRLGFPPASDAAMVRTVQEGILMADDLVASTPLLNSLVGRDIHGHIRRAGIAHRIKNRCDQGELPFVAVMSRMPIGNWHWLEIRSSGAHAHVCRTETAGGFPDDTPNRQDARLTNQFDLFDWSKNIVPISQSLANINSLYTWLTFGIGPKGKLCHLCWASPAPDNNSWLAFANILSSSMASQTSPPDPRTPDPLERMKFKEHIEEALDSDVAIPSDDKAGE